MLLLGHLTYDVINVIKVFCFEFLFYACQLGREMAKLFLLSLFFPENQLMIVSSRGHNVQHQLCDEGRKRVRDIISAVSFSQILLVHPRLRRKSRNVKKRERGYGPIRDGEGNLHNWK